jgi:hypothetical protein
MESPLGPCILFELNEVPWRILDHWTATRPDSALARLLPRSERFTTRTEVYGHLSPWRTWPTLHRGVDEPEHGIQELGQDLAAADRRHPPVWQVLADHGVRVGVYGSLHAWPLPGDLSPYAFFVPDPFAPDASAHPASVMPFQDINVRLSRESARNVSDRLPWREGLTLLGALPRLGIRHATLAAAAGQVLDERRRPWRRVRRRTYQSVLGFDVFRRLLHTTRPGFATFFTNHVASAMHRYWAAAFPGDYATHELDAEWRERFAGEIDFALGWADRWIADLAAHVDAHPGASLWVASSMGQAATATRRVGTQLDLVDVGRFLDALGFPRDDAERRPAMFPQVNFRFPSAGAVERFLERLEPLCIDGSPVMTNRQGEFVSLTLGHPDLEDTPHPVRFAGEPVDPAAFGIGFLPVDEGAESTAYHVPEGSLFVYRSGGSSRAGDHGEIPLREVAPRLLAEFGASLPAGTEAPDRGRIPVPNP